LTSVIVFIKSIIPDIETINNLIYVILERTSDAISTLTTLNDVILPLIIKHWLNATIQQWFCLM